MEVRERTVKRPYMVGGICRLYIADVRDLCESTKGSELMQVPMMIATSQSRQIGISRRRWSSALWKFVLRFQLSIYRVQFCPL